MTQNPQQGQGLKVAIQGQPASFSDQVRRYLFPLSDVLHCKTFGDAFQAIDNGAADLAVLPIRNSTAGDVKGVADVIDKIPVIVEQELPWSVQHCLIGLTTATQQDIQTVHSHIQGLGQCARFIQDNGYEQKEEADTAGAVELIARTQHKAHAAIGPKEAAEYNGLKILAEGIQDNKENQTDFIVVRKAD